MKVEVAKEWDGVAPDWIPASCGKPPKPDASSRDEETLFVIIIATLDGNGGYTLSAAEAPGSPRESLGRENGKFIDNATGQ